ncbi:MAG: CsbD family protein [Alphaproteobacteria bacterium]|nr:CsbD family protein [Alphaproteobacteria bacterium]
MQENECVEAKIKNVWSKLSDDDVKLYGKNADAFYEKLEQKHGLSRDDAMKRIDEFETWCSTAH